MPSDSQVVHAGIAVAAGTRHELTNESGMAHLVEHNCFKGTPRLSSLQILNRIESLGGELNAYTGKEETIYYATFLRQHLTTSLSLLMDIVFHSIFPQEQLEKEIEVVIDEIQSYEDSPAEQIYDDFEGILFSGSPLGRNILGNADSLHQYHSEDLHRFVKRTYHQNRAVLFVKGQVTEQELRRIINRITAKLDSVESVSPQQPLINTTLPITSSSQFSLSAPSSPIIIPRHVHQAHVILGSRAYGATDARFLPLLLLSNILGGPAMNSRLSLSLRERTGLVYTVESSYIPYTDTGVWSVYFGCDDVDVERCLRIVHRQLMHLIDVPLPLRTLTVAKTQLKAQLAISYENAQTIALHNAKRYLHDNAVPSIEDVEKAIDAITASQLQSVAEDILNPDKITTLIYKPTAEN